MTRRCASCCIPHQFFEVGGLVNHLGLLEHPVNDVVLDSEAFELSEPLRLRVKPFYHLGRLLIGLRLLIDQGAHLLRRRRQIVTPHQFADDQAELYPTLRLLLEKLWIDGHVVHLQATRLEVATRILYQPLLLHFDQRVGQVDTVIVDERLHDLLLDLGVEALFHLALHVRLDLGAHAFDIAVGDPEHAREVGVDFGQVGLFDQLQRNGKTRFLASNVLARIVVGKFHRDVLALAGLHAAYAVLEVRQHAALAQYVRIALGLAALEFHAVNRADEVDGHAIAVLRGTLDIVIMHALLAQHLDGLVHFGVGYFERRALDGHAGQIARLEFGIDLEGRIELQLIGRRIGFGFETGITGHAQVLVAHGVTERFLDLVADHFGADLRTVLLCHQLHRHLAGTETRHLYSAREALEALVDLLVDFCDGHGHGQAAFELAQVFYGALHAEERPE